MKVSFLVTYFNQEEYVKQSLDSILKIEMPCDWEILVGDDGSSDGTVDVVKDYIERHPNKIKLFSMPREKSIKYDPIRRASANRLNLLEHAAGDFFCTLDGDDYYCDTKFVEEALDIFKHNQNISIVAFGFKYFKDGIDGKKITIPARKKQHHVNKKRYLSSFYLHAGGCVYRKCFGKKRTDYIKKLGYFDDNDIIINNLNYGDMISIDRVVYVYRQTGNGIYTSMNIVEQAVLNVRGLDVDLQLLKKDYWKNLIERYSNSIITMYMWKDKLKDKLGKDVYDRYCADSATIPESICFDLLNYNSLSEGKRNELKGLVQKLEYRHSLFTTKMLAKYYLRGE